MPWLSVVGRCREVLIQHLCQRRAQMAARQQHESARREVVAEIQLWGWTSSAVDVISSGRHQQWMLMKNARFCKKKMSKKENEENEQKTIIF